jgi:acetyl esterase/lipase
VTARSRRVAIGDSDAGTAVAEASAMRTKWLLVLALGGCASREVETRHVSYDDRFAADTMDVYLPVDGLVDRPAVMFVHGGSWRFGDAGAHAGHAQRLAELGYVAATIDYRLVPEAVYPAQMQDTACALSFLRSQAQAFGLDPDRVAVVGYSAGGHLVSLLGVAFDDPDYAPDCAAGPTAPPQAVVSGAGPQDLRGWSDVDNVAEMLGGTIDEVPERYDAASPLLHARPDAPPFLFVHGTSDWIVPVEQSREMRAALRDQGVDARLLELDGVGHVTGVGGDGGRSELGVMSIDEPEAWLAQLDFLADTVGAP